MVEERRTIRKFNLGGSNIRYYNFQEKNKGDKEEILKE